MPAPSTGAFSCPGMTSCWLNEDACHLSLIKINCKSSCFPQESLLNIPSGTCRGHLVASQSRSKQHVLAAKSMRIFKVHIYIYIYIRPCLSASPRQSSSEFVSMASPQTISFASFPPLPLYSSLTILTPLPPTILLVLETCAISFSA